MMIKSEGGISCAGGAVAAIRRGLVTCCSLSQCRWEGEKLRKVYDSLVLGPTKRVARDSVDLWGSGYALW
jgi:hypothetical protein